MVKGEVDIITDWVMYHGSIFGFRNLYIIDNLSRDGTWQELCRLKSIYKGLNICQLPDYKKKGNYMTSFIKSFCSRGDFAFPIDIDEFIVCYDKQTNTISCDGNHFKQIIKSLPLSAVYKMNYIQCKVTDSNGYERAALAATNGTYDDYGSSAKSFFNTALFNGQIDHGNHYHTNNYILTNLCLLHYHQRNLEQMKKKIYNNVTGLGYNPFDLPALKKLNSGGVMGNHHVNYQINVLEGKFALGISNSEASDINLSPISRFLLQLNYCKSETPKENAEE
jgi:hypothetical protein